MKKTIIAIMASVFLMAACTTGETKNEVPTTDSTAVKTDSTAVKADTSAEKNQDRVK
jgi:protein involved in sex pheromone biosynthesis